MQILYKFLDYLSSLNNSFIILNKEFIYIDSLSYMLDLSNFKSFFTTNIIIEIIRNENKNKKLGIYIKSKLKTLILNKIEIIFNKNKTNGILKLKSLEIQNIIKLKKDSNLKESEINYFKFNIKNIENTKNKYTVRINKKEFENKVIGQIFKQIICLKHKNYLILIDQHALHERIRYENMKKKDIKIKDDKLRSIACRGAIKFNEKISINRMKELIGNIKSINYPFICVHGRNSICALKII